MGRSKHTVGHVTMEEHMSAPVTDAVTASPAGRRQHPRARRTLLLRAGAVLALVAILAAGWWWTHPGVFNDDYGTFGVNPRPVDDATAYLGLSNLEAGQPEETITITGYDVHIDLNEAAARARLLMCTPRDSYGDNALCTGDPNGLEAACGSLQPVQDGTRLTLSEQWPPEEYLVLEVVPTRPGPVVIDELKLSYQRSGDHLFQRGTQQIPMLLGISAI